MFQTLITNPMLSVPLTGEASATFTILISAQLMETESVDELRFDAAVLPSFAAVTPAVFWTGVQARPDPVPVGWLSVITLAVSAPVSVDHEQLRLWARFGP